MMRRAPEQQTAEPVWRRQKSFQLCVRKKEGKKKKQNKTFNKKVFSCYKTCDLHSGAWRRLDSARNLILVFKAFHRKELSCAKCR